jgi:DNA-binding CsgD family transcriptional regulator
VTCSTMLADPASLLAATLRLDYMARSTAVNRDMQSAREQTRAVEILWEATLRMGAEASVFASFIREGETCRSHRLLLACDPTRFAEYECAHRCEFDPWITYATKYSEPVRNSEVSVLGDAARTAVELTQRFGFRSAVIVPVPSSGGLSRTGVLCLGSSKPGYFDDDGYVTLKVVARGVAMELHEWWMQRLREEMVATSGVTPTDLALLTHEMLGHTTKTIARHLGVSISSVDSRFQRLNIKLGTASRKAAAHLAAEYGLI